MHYSAAPLKTGALEPKVKELIFIAIDASTTHQHYQGLKVHLGNAKRYGATQEEIMEVYQIASVQGIHTLMLGVPLLIEEMKGMGRGPEVQRQLTPRQVELKQRFTETTGHWTHLLDGVLQLAPDFFEAYLGLSTPPYKNQVLSPKIRELIYIAIASSSTSLYGPDLRIHIKQALKHGATIDEILETYQCTSVLGIHALTLGVPAMLDVWGQDDAAPDAPAKTPAKVKAAPAKKAVAKKAPTKKPAKKAPAKKGKKKKK
jgi:alkylhydroperoxidase/carboxymuconolactone decarboxylase family protein YurZ